MYENGSGRRWKEYYLSEYMAERLSSRSLAISRVFATMMFIPIAFRRMMLESGAL